MHSPATPQVTLHCILEVIFPGDAFTASRKNSYFKGYIICVHQKLFSSGAEIPHSLRLTPSGPGSSLELRFPSSVNSSLEISSLLNIIQGLRFPLDEISSGWEFQQWTSLA